MTTRTWPHLVREAKTPCEVRINTEEVDADGAPVVIVETEAFCNYQSRARKIRTEDKTFVQVSGICLFDGDLCPSIAEIADGTVKIFDETRRIVQGIKARNPDGSVNYTRLELA
jgi:hypothetical protein